MATTMFSTRGRHAYYSLWLRTIDPPALALILRLGQFLVRIIYHRFRLIYRVGSIVSQKNTKICADSECCFSISALLCHHLSVCFFLFYSLLNCSSCTQLINVQVPFFFKYAVDYFNKLPNLSTPENTIFTIGTALLLGCMPV